MSRSIALIVLVVVGAACLATAEWYDDLYVSDKLLPKDVYGILMSHRSNREAREFAKMWETQICYIEPFTTLYNIPIGSKRDQPVSLKNYIEYCEGYRKKACEKLAMDEEERLLSTSSVDILLQSLIILAEIGDEKAKKILYMEELGKDCDRLDELQELANYPFYGKVKSSTLAKYQKETLERITSECAAVQAVIEEFRRKLVILKDKLTPESLEKLQNLRETAYDSYLKGVDPKDIGKLKKRAHNRRCLLTILYKSIRKSQTKSSCEDVNLILGTHADRKNYLKALQRVPGRMRLDEGELEWIQTLFLCIEETGKVG